MRNRFQPGSRERAADVHVGAGESLRVGPREQTGTARATGDPRCRRRHEWPDRDRRSRQARAADRRRPRANVSTSTASRALNGIGELSDDTRAAVKRAAKELDFRPSPVARSLRTRRSHTVGLVVPTVAHAFYAAVTTGAQAVLEEHGYRLILVDSGEDPATVTGAVRTLLDHEVDGLLVSTAPFGARRVQRAARARRRACSSTSWRPAPAPATSRSRTAAASSCSSTTSSSTATSGSRFSAAPRIARAGMSGYEGFVNGDETPRTRRSTRNSYASASGRSRAASSRHRRSCSTLDARPTALVTASGELGLGALAAARRPGSRSRSELALGCFDDLYFAPLLEPSLTAIAYDAQGDRARGRHGCCSTPSTTSVPHARTRCGSTSASCAGARAAVRTTRRPTSRRR